IPDVPRHISKPILNICLNAKNGTSAIRAAAQELTQLNVRGSQGERYARARSIIAALKKRNQPIAEFFHSEALNKMTEREDEARRAEPEPTLEEALEAVIACLPMSGLGACMAMGTWFNKVKSVATFPFLELCAPIVHQNFPTEWQRFRNAEKRADNA